MLENAKIKNTDELEFAVFCIENVAIRLDKNAEDVYKALTEKQTRGPVSQREVFPCSQ